MSKEAMKLEPCGGCYGSGWITRDPDIGTDQECFVCGGSGVCPKEPAQQEPCKHERINDDGFGGVWSFCKHCHKEWTNEMTVSTAEQPAQRTWVGLTDVEWMNIVNKDQAWFGQRPDEVAHEVAKLIEARLKEKNT